MIRRVYSTVLCAVLLSITGCSRKTTEMQAVQEKKPLVINVLDQKAYDDCHIPGSVRVDFNKVEEYVRGYARDHTIVVYCSNYACMTSHFVAKKLRASGYTQALVYDGGMADWYQAGYPVEGPAEQPYLRTKVVYDENQSDTMPKISTKELAELLKIV